MEALLYELAKQGKKVGGCKAGYVVKTKAGKAYFDVVGNPLDADNDKAMYLAKAYLCNIACG